jgi:endonuclease/exonuclease/phosphatase family metal-dependent hydrolase
MVLRVATYNVENLFTRPKILNLQDSDKIDDLLAKLARFRAIMIDEEKYAPFRKELLALYKTLSAYIAINIRSSDVGRTIITEDRLIAKGKGDWEGFIDLKRDTFSGEQVDNTGRVIKAVNADIQCFVEVEGRLAMQRFDTDILANRFEDLLVIDGNDPRGIDVAMASRKELPIKSVATNIFARDAEGVVFSRDCLEVSFEVGGKPLTVLVNHFKAKDRTPETSDAKRKRQAAQVSKILKKRFDMENDFVIVAGDLNDEPDSDPISPLVGTPGLHNVFDLVNRDPEDRWTYYYSNDRAYNRIDMIFVSEALRAKVKDAGIERRGMADLEKLTGGAQKPFKEVTSWRNAGSDHASVWVDLNL